jgi:hypothetical protein
MQLLDEQRLRLVGILSDLVMATTMGEVRRIQ